MPPEPLTVVWDPRFLDYDFGPDHPFSERSRELAVHLLESVLGPDDAGAVEWAREVAVVPREVLETFHRAGYLDFVEEAGLRDAGGMLDRGDTPAFPGCYEAAARLVGGALRAMSAVSAGRGPAFHPAGGLHHAHPDRASGFCVFNDVAIVVREAVRRGQRVAYVDLDAHHGDGVMYGLYDDGRVLDIDFHQDGRTLFPGTGFPHETGRGDGAGLKVNLPLPPLAGDAALLPLFHRVAVPLLREFRPDVIVVQHGVDGHVGDALAQLQYTPAAYDVVDRSLRDLASELCDGRLVVTGGGGYNAASVSRVLARTAVTLTGRQPPPASTRLPAGWRDEFTRATGEAAPRAWGEHDRVLRSAWSSDDESALIRTLSAALGRRFPAEPD
jgi:acetoin utilization protein AcuC